MNRFVQTRAQNGQNGRVPTPPLAQSVNGDNVRSDRTSARDLKFTRKSGNTAPANTESGPGYASNQFNDAIQTQRQKPLAIPGRFEANKQHQDLQLRNGHVDPDPYRDQGSRKRSRSGGAPHAQVTRGLEQEVPDDDEEDDIEVQGGQADATVRLGDVHFNSDGTEQATPIQSPIRQRKSRTLPQVPSSQSVQDPENPQAQENAAIDPRLIPDYSDAELKLMKYSDLDGEDWDMVPKAKQYELPAELRGRKVTLEKKIEHHLKLDPEQGQLPFVLSCSAEYTLALCRYSRLTDVSG